jgi:EXLDI family protein
VRVPNKTIYVSDGDAPLFQRAQELAGGNLSAAISKALRRWVDTADALGGGFEDITVRVGIGAGRKVRFVAALVGEWVDTNAKRADIYHVYRGRTGKYVIHLERSPDWWAVDAEGKPAGWKGWVGVGDIRYGSVPKESTLEVVDTIEQLRDKVPPELFAVIERAARQPSVEELDI